MRHGCGIGHNTGFATNFTDNYIVQQQLITAILLSPCTYIVSGRVSVSGNVTSSRHSVFIKFTNDSPGLARRCLWNTVTALWAPKGPQTRDWISSFDCPSKFVKYLLISIFYFTSRQLLISSSCVKFKSDVLCATTWRRVRELQMKTMIRFQWNERWSNVLFSVYKYNLFKRK